MILVGIDRDDTITYNPGKGDFGRQKTWRRMLRLLPGVVDGLLLLQELGCIMIVATNQAGIAKCIFDLERQKEVNKATDKLLRKEGVKIHQWMISPYYPLSRAIDRNIEIEGNEWVYPDNHPKLLLRKPNTGMMIQGLRKLNRKIYDFDQVFFIGDSITDVEVALNLGGIGVLIEQGRKNASDVAMARSEPNIVIVKTFDRAARYIYQYGGILNE